MADKQKHSCPMCGADFDTPEQLAGHDRREHQGGGRGERARKYV